MMFRRPTVAIALCLAWFSYASQRASADIVLSFQQNGVDVSHVDVFVGDVAAIEVWATSSGTDLFSFGGHGLSTFGIKATFNPSYLAPDTQYFQTGPAFATVPTVPPLPGASEFTVRGASTSPGGYSGPPSVLLGTIRLAALAPVINSSLSISDPNSSAATNRDFSGPGFTPLDDIVFYNNVQGTVTVVPYGLTVTAKLQPQAVPEPGSLSLVALAGGGLWWAKRRRRRATAAAHDSN